MAMRWRVEEDKFEYEEQTEKEVKDVDLLEMKGSSRDKKTNGMLSILMSLLCQTLLCAQAVIRSCLC